MFLGSAHLLKLVNICMKFHEDDNFLFSYTMLSYTVLFWRWHFLLLLCDATSTTRSSWYGGLNKSLKQKLQVAQNKVVRFILNLQAMTWINYSILIDVNMLKVEDRVKQLRLNHVFKIFHELSPQYLNYNFVRVSDSHLYNTRGSDYKFRIPSISGCDTETFYNNSILYWNNLPENIKSISNKVTFKKTQRSLTYYWSVWRRKNF